MILDKMTQAKRNEIEEHRLQAFAVWWHNEGSAMRPEPDEDAEQHVLRVSQIAWTNGAYCDDQRLRETIGDMLGCEPLPPVSWRLPLISFVVIGGFIFWLLT